MSGSDCSSSTGHRARSSSPEIRWEGKAPQKDPQDLRETRVGSRIDRTPSPDYIFERHSQDCASPKTVQLQLPLQHDSAEVECNKPGVVAIACVGLDSRNGSTIAENATTVASALLRVPHARSQHGATATGLFPRAVSGQSRPLSGPMCCCLQVCPQGARLQRWHQLRPLSHLPVLQQRHQEDAQDAVWRSDTQYTRNQIVDCLKVSPNIASSTLPGDGWRSVWRHFIHTDSCCRWRDPPHLQGSA